MTRRLTLARETLTDLSADDLASVAGGQVTGRDCGWSFPLRECFSLQPTCWTTA